MIMSLYIVEKPVLNHFKKKNSGFTFDILITYPSVPNKDRKSVAENLNSIDPKNPIILSTFYIFFIETGSNSSSNYIKRKSVNINELH
jgi:hypothetical protein